MYARTNNVQPAGGKYLPQIGLLCLICAVWYNHRAIDLLSSVPTSYGIIVNRASDLSNATVLITGVAGFIGYSLASHILQHDLGKVVGIDNFNHYYDVGLKYRRADILSHWRNMHLIEEDINNSSLVRNVLQQHNVTHVVHLAAQAGVRYSLENPFAYVQDNIKCFVAILEELRHLRDNPGDRSFPRFVYASSSSVYGGNTKIPFDEADPVENPSSVYGASKRMNELLALVYHKTFGIGSVGLRFFTVYGPWGRPDMAPFRFTQNIERGDNVTVYNKGLMDRDFTYIDDIVSGLIAAMNFPASSSMIFNLRKGEPDNVLDLVRIIEQKLGRTAQTDFQTSAVDLSLTYAATTKARTLLHFEPKVWLQDGMQQFIDWYLAYSGTRFLCASK